MKKIIVPFLAVTLVAGMLTACSQQATESSTPAIADLVPLDSSLISGAKYEAGTQALVVQFADGGAYTYAGVSQELYEGLMAAESKGSYFQENIKGAFESTKL